MKYYKVKDGAVSGALISGVKYTKKELEQRGISPNAPYLERVEVSPSNYENEVFGMRFKDRRD